MESGMMSMTGSSVSVMEATTTVSSSPGSTMAGMLMPSTTSGSATPSPTSSMMMGMDQMAMVFFTSTTTPLFSSSWIPTGTGEYAGTCIFLIVFAAIFRALVAVRFRFYDIMAAVRHRRPNSIDNDWKRAGHVWRANEAVTVASVDAILAGAGYLLMIAVMTMNVGYFLSILSGVFLGSMTSSHFVAGATVP